MLPSKYKMSISLNPNFFSSTIGLYYNNRPIFLAQLSYWFNTLLNSCFEDHVDVNNVLAVIT
jgi:hypothetical protein